MTFLSVSLKILVGLVLLFVVALLLLQSKLIFYPVKIKKDFEFKFANPHEEKFIAYGDQTVHGLLFKSDHPRVRIIYFHGNGGSLDSWGELGSDLSQKLICDILLIDYPGYGKSTGGLPTSEKALYESAQAAFEEFQKSTDSHLPIIVYGRSLGSGVASYLASKNQVQALILETPYTSIKAMAKVVLPFVPSFLVRYDLDNEKNIQGLNIPILVLHGTSDSTIPYSQGKELAASKSGIDFVTIEGGHHNDLDNYKDYWVAVDRIIAKVKAN